MITTYDDDDNTYDNSGGECEMDDVSYDGHSLDVDGLGYDNDNKMKMQMECLRLSVSTYPSTE